jgi:hypothetical protein
MTTRVSLKVLLFDIVNCMYVQYIMKIMYFVEEFMIHFKVC